MPCAAFVGVTPCAPTDNDTANINVLFRVYMEIAIWPQNGVVFLGATLNSFTNYMHLPAEGFVVRLDLIEAFSNLLCGIVDICGNSTIGVQVVEIGTFHFYEYDIHARAVSKDDEINVAMSNWKFGESYVLALYRRMCACCPEYREVALKFCLELSLRCTLSDKICNIR